MPKDGDTQEVCKPCLCEFQVTPYGRVTNYIFNGQCEAESIVSNTLNICVFSHQGFKEGPTIYMTVISVWNFLKCLCGFVTRLSYPISLLDPALGVTWDNVTFPYIEYTTIFAGYVAFALAGFVSIERFMCVWRPFTAKSLLAPSVTLLFVIFISFATFSAFVVVYFIYAIRYEFSETLNSTVAKYVFSDFYYQNTGTVMKYYQIIGILLPTTSFIIMCIFSSATVLFLKRSSLLLHKDPAHMKTVSVREKQVSKTVFTVVVVYIINLFPRFLFYIAQLAEPEFYNLRKLHNLFVAIVLFIFVLDFCNSSIHFFIFFKLSLNFRKHFLKCICTRPVIARGKQR
ncbi:hypothetical protein Btru_052887 [Bulinus truncatus]|nr:hypothetical protein Btru_052887 [Bulinus truncatus]